MLLLYSELAQARPELSMLDPTDLRGSGSLVPYTWRKRGRERARESERERAKVQASKRKRQCVGAESDIVIQGL